MIVPAAIAVFASMSASSAFSIVEDRGVYAFRAPDGSKLWSLGVDCVDSGVEWDRYDSSNPSYAAYKLFPSGQAWTQDTLEKLKSWRVNSLGGWSDYDLFKKYQPEDRLPYFVVLHLGAYAKAPWDDIFSKKNIGIYDQAAANQIPKFKDDAKLVGYFSDNELGWWSDTLFKTYYSMPWGAEGRQALQGTLLKHYRGKFREFKKDWISDARSFASLKSDPPIQVRPGGNSASMVNDWMAEMANHYYETVARIIRKYDSKHLVLGDRYAQYFQRQFAIAAGKSMDAISTNAGATWNDGTYSPFYFESLHALSGKPILITEFYMCARQNRSGNKNSSAGFPMVDTQEQRATSFGRNLRELASLPYVIGAHWFQFYDEPSNGRGDGENYNMGLVDVHGQAYEGMVHALQNFPLEALRRDAREPASGWLSPPAPPNPIDLEAWDRADGRLKPAAVSDFADLYTAWTSDALYLGLIHQDYFDESLWPGGRIAEMDRPLLTGSVGKASFSIRFCGHGQQPTSSGLATVAWEGPSLGDRLVIKISAKDLGVDKIEIGQKLRVKLLDTMHGRAETTFWTGELHIGDVR